MDNLPPFCNHASVAIQSPSYSLKQQTPPPNLLHWN